MSDTNNTTISSTSPTNFETTLTEGPIWKRMVSFAIPLFFGNLFQQLYNAADSLIVGNFLGKQALAAVSSTSSLIFLLVGFFNGIAIGAGVVIAHYYGAKETESLRKAVHTTVAFGIICGLALMVIGLVMVPSLLRLMRTPSDVLPNSILYFRIYFLGSLAFVLYNNFVGILQSVGDSKHPLYYLIFSSLLNIVLDLILIGVFHFGVGAAALATIISQFASALMCLYRLLFKCPKEYRLTFKELRLDPCMLRQVIKNGLPSGMQNSIISIANVFVQSNINAFGSVAVAGCGSYSRIDGFAFLPVICFSMALTTFISQNLGAKKYDRVKKGGRFGILCGIILAELVGLTIYFTIPLLIACFNRDPEIIAYGVKQAHTLTPFFFLCAFSHCMAGLLRGAGKSTVPMYIMMVVWCFIRVAYISIIVRFIPTIDVVFWGYPLTWFLSSIAFLYYYLKTDWVHGYPH